MSNRNNKSKMAKFLLIFIMSFMFIYVGLFLFLDLDGNGRSDRKKDGIREFEATNGAKIKATENSKEDIVPPVQYKHWSTEVNGNKQEVNILEINPRSERVKVKPVLSFNSVFGFEKLSAMALRWGAYAAVNAGFFHEFGQPSGMIVIDGEVITGSTGNYPLLIVKDKRATLEILKSELWISGKNNRILADDINILGLEGKTVIYTDKFGTDNRAKIENTTATIEKGVVTKVGKYEGKVNIPRGGMLLSYYGQNQKLEEDLQSKLKVGDEVELLCYPNLGNEAQVYECGSWIIKDGQVVIGEKDEWVGVMTNWDPRTAVGIKEDGNILLLTVDGRQPGYSVGLTGYELGNLLLELGAKNAAMLDGGASTEMILQGRIVNRPSHKGQERPLAGAIIVEYSVEHGK